MQALAEGKYFEMAESGSIQWPQCLKAMFSEREGVIHAVTKIVVGTGN